MALNDRALIEAVFNHLVLPPKVPSHAEEDPAAIQTQILDRAIRACNTLRELTGEEFTNTWLAVRHSLSTCLTLNQGRLDKSSMLRELSNIRHTDLIILYVVEQNAAVLIRRDAQEGVDNVIFEAFEASPTSQDVLAAKNALQWDFPGRAAQISMDEFLKESFRESLASFLEQASMESVSCFEARATKAKTSVSEARDTSTPALITQMLMPLLEAVGSSVDVPLLRKRVRDDVNIGNAKLPWRRLPFWLVLRVGIQRYLCSMLGNEAGRACFKFVICIMLAQLLEESAGQLPAELTLMLRAKLGRRLAKLEQERSQSDLNISEQLFDATSPLFKRVIIKATAQVDSAWANFKMKTTRQVPLLPDRARDEALRLSLPQSANYLRSILALFKSNPETLTSRNVMPVQDVAMTQAREFIERCLDLARLENELETARALTPNVTLNSQSRCIQLKDSIMQLFTKVGTFYDSNPEQMSIFILTLFDLWVQLDKCAVEACPLLGDYQPVFSHELLDVLHLPQLAEMRRLHAIQRYLSDRSKNSTFARKTIFSEPDKDCFAAQFLEQSPALQNLSQEIELASMRSRERKLGEWARVCKEYDDLSEGISSGTCICSFNPDGTRNVSGCKKCWYWRKRKRLGIDVHENFLPDDTAQKAAVVFELDIPAYLAAYRNATWEIFQRLAHPSRPENSSPAVTVLKEYSQLRKYSASATKGVTLASAKKSFLQTHYKISKVKGDRSKIILPLALDFCYYDSTSQIWLRELDLQPTFQHLCGVYIPRCLQASVIQPSSHPLPDVDGPSSYEIIASQTKCPSDTSIHEFLAYQRLLSGKSRRWLTMLVELGSTNLNFSNGETMHIFNQLAVQAGPAHNEAGILRDAHLVFQDQSFCRRLTEQLDLRVRNISSNWREAHCMEIILTLSLRLFNLASGSFRQSAERLLEIIRKTTLSWTSRLRAEARTTEKADVAETASRYGFWAALLCRRTFTVFGTSKAEIDEDALDSWIQASIALQENLPTNIDNLSEYPKTMLIRDMKMAQRLKPIILRSAQLKPERIGAAICKSWSTSSDTNWPAFFPWKFHSHPYDAWCESTIVTQVDLSTNYQRVHYNFVEGQLLVDGEPLGKLPSNIKSSGYVKEIFGNQHLLTYASPLSGMSHRLATTIAGNQIHFGLLQEKVVIRAITQSGDVLEHIPRQIFEGSGISDLPSSLLENCVHWLNLSKGQLEIRRMPYIWRTRKSDWILDVSNRCARRKNSTLVDPHSALCKSVARIFQHFEDPQRLTVFQPQRGKLSVELRHLELSFVVNPRTQLLLCRELRAEIDPDQDAGTLYGFQSKIVLRDLDNKDRRSLITPLGSLVSQKHGIHVLVSAKSSNQYLKFEIDNVLGRLSCPPEPVLLYAKAQFHAHTSFVLPDPLTKRSGADEAIHTLKSGHCQPWTTMNDQPRLILEAIKSLSPIREYYPKDKRRLQKVTWNPSLTLGIQHDCYESTVQGLLDKSEKLQAFTMQTGNDTTPKINQTAHLRTRGEIRRSLYERCGPDTSRSTRSEDVIYHPRDRDASSSRSNNVFRIVKLIREPQFRVPTMKSIISILQEKDLIGGFHENSPSIPPCLSDLIEDDLIVQWGDLVNDCRNSDAQNHHKMLFRLATLAFGTNPDMNIIMSLAAFIRLHDLKIIPPPACTSFRGFKIGETPTMEQLQAKISTAYVSFVPPMNLKMTRREAAYLKHQTLCEAEGHRLASLLLEQWPSAEPNAERIDSSLVNVDLALESVIPEFSRMYSNMELSDYLVQVQRILKLHQGKVKNTQTSAWNAREPIFRATIFGSIVPSLSEDLVVKSTTKVPNLLASDFGKLAIANSSSKMVRHANQPNGFSKDSRSREVSMLADILSSFEKSPDALRQAYANDLKDSLSALDVNDNLIAQKCPPSIDVIKDYIKTTRSAIDESFENIRESLSGGDDRFWWLQTTNLWPCLSPVTVLELLRSKSNHCFGENMRELLVAYALLIASLQRFQRVAHAHLKGDNRRLLEEWSNNGHENWDPLSFPDWLLLEIESNLLIRPEQIDVAHAIMAPASQSNSVLQMNMGKGKTSCIVPMVVAILADQSRLSRLIVPKALLLQTAQTLQSRIGGLVGREVRHIPFSRRTPTTESMLNLYRELHDEIRDSSGVLLTTPEHILSYKLSGFERLTKSSIKEAGTMITFQSWLDEVCRDVLDESDFTLAVKTQLIYPNPPQIAVDGHAIRWRIPQMLLSVVEDHLPDLQRIYPRSLEVVKRAQGFPSVYFLQKDVEDELHRRIINDICSGRTSLLRFNNSIPTASRLKIRSVLSEEKLDNKLVGQVMPFFADPKSASKAILLIRGLLVSGILLLCLKKRWNVQYGLHPDRDPVAVPFEAKGVPSEQAEFGHPDVAILFTCLAFYYSGLTLPQFRECLQHILKSDDPAFEYDKWSSGCDTLPEALRHWNVINVDDQGQLQEVWQHLRLTRNVLDYYMNNFVFPVHAKQFCIKLQASGWDLPLFSIDGGSSGARTTGFSGTNDNKMMLPLNIKQDDLPSLRQTNAEVLTYFLQGRNRRYRLAASQGKRLTELGLLHKITTMGIRILIDAGAYILEMDNEMLVKAWLDIETQAKGAVFFKADNRAWVHFRGAKKSVPLVATPFAENLEDCLVYLDEVHTRGIDLKLPQGATGALTLALGQTKDHTAQAAMRLRQLGSTQSVVFFAPPEVHQSIIDVCKKRQGEELNSTHVVQWLLEQTCRTNEQLQNLYIAQGLDFCRRKNAQLEHKQFLKSKGAREAFLGVIRQPERQTLEQLYGGLEVIPAASSPNMSSAELTAFVEKLCELRQTAACSPSAIHSSVLEEVEQQREVVEIQQEEIRHVQKPKHHNALTFRGLHPAILRFAKEGNLCGELGYERAFEALSRTALARKYQVCNTMSRLFVSAEFTRTVKLGKGGSDDTFMRPVEWILWNPANETALILVSEEAEILIPLIRKEKPSKVHLIAYAAPVTKNMAHFNELSYYALPPLPRGHRVPEWLSVELGIFAGRLYPSYSECVALGKYLRQANYANSERSEGDSKQSPVFCQNPIEFLLEWLSLRRKGQDVEHTPVGFVCHGRPMHETHPFFLVRSTDAAPDGPCTGFERTISGSDVAEEDGDTDLEDEGEEGEEEEGHGGREEAVGVEGEEGEVNGDREDEREDEGEGAD